jgi:hypothetical protein
MEGWPAINNTDRCSKLPTSIVIRGGTLTIDGRKSTPPASSELLLGSRCHEVEEDQGRKGSWKKDGEGKA